MCDKPDLTPDLKKRLIYSKYFLERAKSLLRQGNELASAEAVLVAHDSAEMLMSVVADRLGVNLTRNFMAFWDIVKKETQAEPPSKNTMDRLNKLRVGFKHAGNLPHPSVVTDVMPGVIAFCEELAHRYLGLNYKDVSLADLILNAEACDKVKEAERARAAGDVAAALLALGIAFDKLHDEARKTHHSGLIEQGYWDRLGHVRGADRYARQLAGALKLDELMKPVQQLIDTMNMVLLGIEPAKFRRFSEITPVRMYMQSGKLYHRLQRPPDKVPREDLDFCYEFVIDFGLRLVASS